MTNKSELATLGAGCFWCTEAVYAMLDGIIDVKPGYSGGHVTNPTRNLTVSRSSTTRIVREIP